MDDRESLLSKPVDGKMGEDGPLPKFDLRQAFPTMSVTSWHLVQKSLELGEEPKGMVAICPDGQEGPAVTAA